MNSGLLCWKAETSTEVLQEPAPTWKNDHVPLFLAAFVSRKVLETESDHILWKMKEKGTTVLFLRARDRWRVLLPFLILRIDLCMFSPRKRFWWLLGHLRLETNSSVGGSNRKRSKCLGRLLHAQTGESCDAVSLGCVMTKNEPDPLHLQQRFESSPSIRRLLNPHVWLSISFWEDLAQVWSQPYSESENRRVQLKPNSCECFSKKCHTTFSSRTERIHILWGLLTWGTDSLVHLGKPCFSNDKLYMKSERIMWDHIWNDSPAWGFLSSSVTSSFVPSTWSQKTAKRRGCTLCPVYRPE